MRRQKKSVQPRRKSPSKTRQRLFLSGAMPLRGGRVVPEKRLIHQLDSDLRHSRLFWQVTHPEGGLCNFGEDQLLDDEKKRTRAGEGKTVEFEFKTRLSDGSWSVIPDDEKDLVVSAALRDYEPAEPDKQGQLPGPGMIHCCDDKILVTLRPNTYAHTMVGLNKERDLWLIVDVCGQAGGKFGFDNQSTARIAKSFHGYDMVISDNGLDRSGMWSLGKGEWLTKMNGFRSRFAAAIVFFADKNCDPTRCYEKGVYRRLDPNNQLIDVHVTTLPVDLVTPHLSLSSNIQLGGYQRAHGAVYYDAKDGQRVVHDPFELRKDHMALATLVEQAKIECADGTPVMAQSIGNLICNSSTLAWRDVDQGPIARRDELDLAANGKRYQGIGVLQDGKPFASSMNFV